MFSYWKLNKNRVNQVPGTHVQAKQKPQKKKKEKKNKTRKLTDTSLVLFNLKPHDKQMTEWMNKWTTDWMNDWMTGILTSHRLAGQQTTLKSKV